MLTDTQVDRIVDNIIATGGATFNANGLFSYLQGYQVGINGSGLMHDLPKRENADAYRAVIDNKVRVFANKKWVLIEENFDLGAWVDGGVLYLDVTRHYSDRELAVKRGTEMGEKAVWDWATMSEIPCLNWTTVEA